MALPHHLQWCCGVPERAELAGMGTKSIAYPLNSIGRIVVTKVFEF